MASERIKIGLIREGKVPTDKRVALTPVNCIEIMEKFPKIEIVVQPSKIRVFLDSEYKALGIKMQEDLHDCDILMGIKEVPIADLIENKTYFFFSHTIKKQTQNKKLLQAVLNKKIRLIDYECLKNKAGERLVAFGHFAGVVGAYNTIKTFGHRYRLFNLKPAWQCYDYGELKLEFKKVLLKPIKIVVTGGGRVAQGAMETLNALGIMKVSPYDFLHRNFNHSVYAQIHALDMHQTKDRSNPSKEFFYQHPESYTSTFLPYARKADVLIACHYWNPNAPHFFSTSDMRSSSFKIKVIGDISCDVHGPIPSTIKTTSIENPVYDFNPYTQDEDIPYSSEKNVTVMAVDNLPCELARDACFEFGQLLIQQVIPHISQNDSEAVLKNATIANSGYLQSPFSYLQDFVV